MSRRNKSTTRSIDEFGQLYGGGVPFSGAETISHADACCYKCKHKVYVYQYYDKVACRYGQKYPSCKTVWLMGNCKHFEPKDENQ